MRVVKRSDDAQMRVKEGPVIKRDDALLRVVYRRRAFTTRIYDAHLRRAVMTRNAYQGRPCHKGRRHAFACRNLTTRVFMTRITYQGRPCHKGRQHAFVCRNLTTHVFMTRNAYQESSCQEKPCHK